MVAWHRSGTADLGWRASGVLLCAVAYLAISHLLALQPLPDHRVGAESFILAAIGFLAASTGSAIACLGHHLFDRVEVSERWRTGRVIPLDGAVSPLGMLSPTQTRTDDAMPMGHAA